tara:strand:+ start:5379 stop:5591 length:213 start_codon:yes stop_codon:yes gene_type:complete
VLAGGMTVAVAFECGQAGINPEQHDADARDPACHRVTGERSKMPGGISQGQHRRQGTDTKAQHGQCALKG